MPISFNCPYCGEETTTFSGVGEMARCQSCDRKCRVPEERKPAQGDVRPVPASGRPGSRSEGQNWGPVRIGGVDLACRHCGCRGFTEGPVLLNTRGMTFFGLDWLNEDARVFACRNCGCLHWFGQGAGERARQDDEDVCLSCGAELPEGQMPCPACGWTGGRGV